MRSTLIGLLVGLAACALIVLAIVPQAFTAEQETEEKVQSICPKTLMKDSCMSCHTYPNFKVKEGNLDETRDYPIFNMKVRNGVGYYFLEKVDADEVWKFFDYLKGHEIDRAVIEIMSPGGSLFEAGAIVSYMVGYPGYVETRTRGFAASAGCLIFLAGDNRFIDPMAFLMWHELWTFKFLSVETPSDKEEEARILRYIQDTINTWMAGRTALEKEKIDEKIRKKEFWANGKDAIGLGLAEGYITE